MMANQHGDSAEDSEDAAKADQVLRRIREGKEDVLSAEEVWKPLEE
jgi:predicted DNA-binding protein